MKTPAIILIAALSLTLQAHAQMNHTGLNLSGDAALSANQRLNQSESAGAFAQKFWVDASGTSGQTALEIDGGSSMAVVYSGYSATWQGAATGSSSASAFLPNAKLMKGSLLGTAQQPVIVQFNGLPLPYTSGGYALVVYADVPGNTNDVILKATIQAGATTRSLYLLDAANAEFSGGFLRGAVNSTTASGAVAGNYFLFTGLNSSSVAVVVEPAQANPNATVAVNAAQIVPGALGQSLAPRLTSASSATVGANESFNYLITTDVLATTVEVSGLPAGLTFNPATMRITGAPTQAGTHNVTITVRNSAGATAETFVLTVLNTETVELDIYTVPAVVVSGQVGQVHRIEAASSLGSAANWQPVTTLTLTNTAQVWVDVSATNQYKRFYRSRLLP